MGTALQLLMTDGAVQIAFHPRLNASQYAELIEIAAAANTKTELRLAAALAAERWSVKFLFDDLGV